MPKENNNIPTGLYWQGKRTEVERISLPFQTIETINESRATRGKEKDTLFRSKHLPPLAKGGVRGDFLINGITASSGVITNM